MGDEEDVMWSNFDDDSWDSNTSDDSWGSNTEYSASSDDMSDASVNSDASFSNDMADNFSMSDTIGSSDEEKPTKSLGYGATAIILIACCVVLAIIVSFISNIGISDNKSTEVVTTSQADTQSEVVSSGSQLVEVPADTSVNYNTEILNSQGQVQNKTKFLYENQLIHCIEISMQLNGINTIVRYYCGYSAFSSVNIGDTISVQYQKVSDGCYSVVTITKP